MCRLAVAVDGYQHQVTVQVTGSEISVSVDGTPVRVTLPDGSEGARQPEWVLIDDRPYEIVYERDLQWLRAWGGLHRLEVRDLEAGVEYPRRSDGRVKAPIPGQITRLMVVVGQVVALGDPLLVLEAMKMENVLRTPCAGEVRAVHVAPGQNVALNQVLVEILH
jgi:biotin carboxyl carrier protein